MSAFFERKIRTLYQRFDVDGSGSIDVADFNLWGERLVAYGKLTYQFRVKTCFFLNKQFFFKFYSGHLNEQQTNELRKSLTTLWTHYFCPMDANKDGKEALIFIYIYAEKN